MIDNERVHAKCDNCGNYCDLQLNAEVWECDDCVQKNILEEKNKQLKELLTEVFHNGCKKQSSLWKKIYLAIKK